MSEKLFYITTPLYYVNAQPHIGHAYTTLAADILNRFRRMQGQSTFFLTGTDEHGQKVEQAAQAAGKSPQAYADQIAQQFKETWKSLDVSYDDFIRTTEPRHTSRVQAIFKALLDSGDIYKGIYKGFYCTSCETYWTETDLADIKKPVCPNAECGKPLHWVEEESYFFAQSRYQDRLLKHYREHPEFLQPSQRANEILRFVESGLRDVSVSRSKVAWGVAHPLESGLTLYVWFDAILNYISATGYAPAGATVAEAAPPPSSPHPSFETLWPANVQLVGKEIYRFHTVLWPAILMALKLPLPQSVFAHGWWTVEGEKMSKSKGNFIDPLEITREYGVDSLRYFLFREMPFGNDGNFSRDAMRQRYNSELANDLGNLMSRVVQMVDKYLGGELPRRPPLEQPFLSTAVANESKGIYESMERLAFQDALNRIWAVIGRLNRHVDHEAPWTLAKTHPEKLRFLLFDLVWSLRIIAGWIYPFMPQTAAKMQSMLGVRRTNAYFTPQEVLHGPSDAKILKSPPLFPRK